MYPENIMEIIAKMESSYWIIKQEISGLSENILKRKTEAYERSIFGILYHLDFHEQVYMSYYIRKFMYHKDLTFNSLFEEEDWNYRCRGTALEQLESFRAERERNLDLLRNCGLNVWKRVGFHSTRGEINLLYAVKKTMEHDYYHIDHICNIKEWIKNNSWK